MQDDGFDVWHDTSRATATNVFEDDPREPEFTGILNAAGDHIMRVPVPKPPVGFNNPAHLYDHDPDIDFFYVFAKIG